MQLVHHVSQCSQIVVSCPCRYSTSSRSSRTTKSRYFRRRGGGVAPVSARHSVGSVVSRLFTFHDRYQFVDVGMATAYGFVQPAVPSLHRVIRPCRGGMDVPHRSWEVPVEPRGVVVSHQTVQRHVLVHQGPRL